MPMDMFRKYNCYNTSAACVTGGNTVYPSGLRAITAETDLPLCRLFGASNGYWLGARASHDTEIAAKAIAAELKRIKPWAGSAA